jgi:hypothetical protein
MVMTDDESVKASATELSRHKTSLDAAQAMGNASDLAQEDALGLHKNGNISFVRLTSWRDPINSLIDKTSLEGPA